MALVLAYDMSTRTSGGLMKNLATTGATYDGTINGTYTPAPPLIRAKKSPCMLFDGVNNYITFPDISPLIGTPGYTIAVWVNCTQAGPSRCSIIGAGSIAQRLYLEYDHWGGATNFESYANEYNGWFPTTSARSKFSRPINETHFICLSINRVVGSPVRIFMDSQVRMEPWLGPAALPSGIWYVGQEPGLSRPWKGYIDNLLIYNSALLPEQVHSIRRSANPR